MFRTSKSTSKGVVLVHLTLDGKPMLRGENVACWSDAAAHLWAASTTYNVRVSMHAAVHE
jgi:hypothetical protein